jgi:Uma2 family endonuclease
MSNPATARLTLPEYLEFERAANTRHEFFDGQIYAMSCASRQHNRICLNLIQSLGRTLRGTGCSHFGMDMRVKVGESGLYTYPDLLIVCGSPEFEDSQQDTLLNPNVIIEVLSASTERYDRGRKFAHYSALQTLEEYVLISQEEPRVEAFLREGRSDWRLTVSSDWMDLVGFPTSKCVVAISEVYEGVEFPSDDPLREN